MHIVKDPVHGECYTPMKTKFIETDQGQAILIPEDFRIENPEEVLINESGGVYMVWPVKDPLLPLKQSIGQIPDDFMEDRNQPMLNVKS